MEKKDEFFLVCTHPLQGTLRQGRRRGGEEGVVLLLRAAVGGTRLRMRDVLQADRALADLVELAAPAASASCFPAGSLRFPASSDGDSLSLQFPKKRKRQRTHQHALDARAVDAGRAQVGEHDVVVGAAGDERVAALLQAWRGGGVGRSFCCFFRKTRVSDFFLPIIFFFFALSFLQNNTNETHPPPAPWSWPSPASGTQ